MQARHLRFLLAGAFVALALAPAGAQDSPSVSIGSGFPGVVIGGGMEGVRLRQLITRPDVQRGLGLDLQQKNAIKELFSNPQRNGFQVKLESNGPPDPEALRQSAAEQIRAQQGDLETQVKKIVKPDQFDRLLELDLQWRGPLALADQKVAEKLKIERAHRAEIDKAASAYRTEKQEVLMKLAEKNDDGNGRIMVRMNTKELDNPLSASAKQLSKAKEAAEKKILAVLSTEERARWDKAQGESFTFRVDIPGNRF